MAVRGTIPALPNGVRIVDKPSDLEMLCRRNAERWRAIVEALRIMENGKCVQVDVPNVSKSKLQSMRNSLNHYCKIIRFKHKIRFALKNDILYIWVNKI
jgi:hypothetical protein